MKVVSCDAPGKEWDAFVEAQPGFTLAHAAAWTAVVGEAYGIESCHLVARGDDGALRGVLPLARVRTLSGARELVSMPYLDGGGILAADDEAAHALLRAGCDAAREAGARALELRQAAPLRGLALSPAPADRVDLYLALATSEEAQWQALPASVRNQTRKAAREGLRLAPADRDLCDAFCEPYEVNMRDLGSPPHARAFFRACARAFGERLRFVVALDGERPVGGLVALQFGSTVTVPWASTLRSERRRCPNNLIYWEALRWAVERGAGEFDFGRSPRGSGTHLFKRGWGAGERDLCWVRLSPDGKELPPKNPRDHALLARLSSMWTHLPIGVARRLGAWLRPYLTS